jgi:hypothetical protein
MNRAVTPDAVKEMLVSLLDDLRRRRLLAVAGLMLAALVAIPLLLSHGASSQPTASRSPAAGGAADVAASAGAAPGTTAKSAGGSRTSHGSARNPFVQPISAAGGATSGGAASGGATSGGAAVPAAGATTPPASTGAGTAAAPHPASSATPKAKVRTVTRTVTVRVPTPAPKPLFTSYAAQLSFGQTGATPQRIGDASRFTVLPSLRRVAAIFLGVLGDRRSAEFLLSNRVAVTGDGRCVPSRAACAVLTLKPGQEALVLLRNPGGSVSEYALRYRGVHVSRSTTPRPAPVSRAGGKLMSEIEKRLPRLPKPRYASRTGLLTLDLRAVSAALAGPEPRRVR